MNTSVKNITRLSALSAALLLVLTGCAGTPETAPASSAAETSAGQTVTIQDAWVKAVDEGMSGAFGVLVNSGDDDAVLVSATTKAAEHVELHETVKGASGEMVMREAEGGFTIPGSGEFALEPGGHHIMLMGLTGPLKAGDEVTVTLTFSDESTSEFTAPVKDFTGANENYDSDHDSDHGGDH